MINSTYCNPSLSSILVSDSSLHLKQSKKNLAECILSKMLIHEEIPTTTLQNAMYNFFVSRLFEEIASLVPWANTKTNEFQTQNRARHLAQPSTHSSSSSSTSLQISWPKGTGIWALLDVPKMVEFGCSPPFVGLIFKFKPEPTLSPPSDLKNLVLKWESIHELETKLWAPSSAHVRCAN